MGVVKQLEPFGDTLSGCINYCFILCASPIFFLGIVGSLVLELQSLSTLMVGQMLVPNSSVLFLGFLLVCASCTLPLSGCTFVTTLVNCIY